jgi:antitoxin VapB
MAFNVKNDEADRLLRALTALTGESLTDAITESLRQRLAREQRIRCLDGGDPLAHAIAEFRRLTVLDQRSADEILGYDEYGVPT